MRINATTAAMPPPSSAPLTDAERAVLNNWLAQGLPAGAQACAMDPDAGTAAQPAGSSIDVSGLECHKFLSHAPGDKSAKYKVGAAVEAYVDMAFSAGWQGVRYGAVIRPVVDNMRAIHHRLLYEEPGTDGTVESGIGQHPSGHMVAGWAPGGPDYDFRQFGDVAAERSASLDTARGSAQSWYRSRRYAATYGSRPAWRISGQGCTQSPVGRRTQRPLRTRCWVPCSRWPRS